MEKVVWTGVRFSAPPPNSKTPDLHSIRRSGVIFYLMIHRVQVFFFIQFRGIFPYISPYFLANLTNDSPVIRGSGQSISPIAASKSLLHFAMSLDAAAATPLKSPPRPLTADSSATEHRLAMSADCATSVPAPRSAPSVPGSSSANSDASRSASSSPTITTPLPDAASLAARCGAFAVCSFDFRMLPRCALCRLW